MEGIINVLKPPGMTSHDVISFLRRTLGERQIGHAGTLDPQAAGVLPVCIGRATRLVDYIGNGRKSYLCEMKLGIATDTQDAWGKILYTKPIPSIDYPKIELAALSFLGNIKQKVPAYSAIKVCGQPLYKAARRGEDIKDIYRYIDIFQIKIINFCKDRLKFWVECGKGTYVRTLCQDLGEALGTTGHMSFLLRTSVGNFNLKQTTTLEDIAKEKERIILPMELGVSSLPIVHLTYNQSEKIKHGQSLFLEQSISNQLLNDLACFDQTGKLLAIGQWLPNNLKNSGQIKPRKVFN